MAVELEGYSQNYPMDMKSSKSFDLSCEDAQDMNDQRSENERNNRLTHVYLKTAVKTV